MKSAFILAFSVSILLLGSCSRHTHTHTHVHSAGKLPPGQAKKVTGSKSAKPYAPGQQKKKH